MDPRSRLSVEIRELLVMKTRRAIMAVPK